MKIVIASESPVKESAVRKAFTAVFPATLFEFELVKAHSGVSEQPLSDDEMRLGAIGRIKHARELSADGDYYVGLEGGVAEMYGDMYNFGWVVVESAEGRQGFGRTIAFALPTAIRDLIVHEGLEQSHATDKLLSKTDTKTGTGTIGPLTHNVLTYTDWYEPAVICALIPFVRPDLYPSK